MNVVLVDFPKQDHQRERPESDPAEDVQQALQTYASIVGLLQEMLKSKAHSRYLVDDWQWFADTTYDATVLRKDLEQAYINGDG
jgi:hypothetical protein